MEARMRPIGDPSHLAMLDRIEVNIAEARVIIPLILDRMLPKSSLPNIPFVFRLPSG
jgi:hypothetical protein